MFFFKGTDSEKLLLLFAIHLYVKSVPVMVRQLYQKAASKRQVTIGDLSKKTVEKGYKLLY